MNYLIEVEVRGFKYWLSFPHKDRHNKPDFRRPRREGLQDNAYAFKKKYDADYVMRTAQVASDIKLTVIPYNG